MGLSWATVSTPECALIYATCDVPFSTGFYSDHASFSNMQREARLHSKATLVYLRDLTTTM